jgi:hypothetical protein
MTIDWWTVGTTVILIAFNLGVVYQMIKTKPTREEVNDMIDKKFTNHCPFAEKINDLDNEHIEKIVDRRIEFHPLLQKYNVTQYRIEQLEPDVKEIKSDIQTIKLALAKIKGE